LQCLIEYKERVWGSRRLKKRRTNLRCQGLEVPGEASRKRDRPFMNMLTRRAEMIATFFPTQLLKGLAGLSIMNLYTPRRFRTSCILLVTPQHAANIL
jgi:hypothetical protein